MSADRDAEVAARIAIAKRRAILAAAVAPAPQPKQPRHKRGRCTHCGHRFSLTNAGLIWRHAIRGTSAICGGSGGRPA